MTCLSLENVHVTRKSAHILKGVDCALSTGQIVGIVGPNGAGKSTLLNAIARLVPFDGKIRWQGSDVSHSEIGYMPQHCFVDANLSVLEIVLLGLHQTLGWRIRDEQVNLACNVLSRFNLDHLAARSMQSLSGGQQQLVLLAQRLVRSPSLLILDESTSALDIRHQMRVFELLRDYVKKTGSLVLIAIHDLNLASRHSDSVVCISKGKVVGHGPFRDVINAATLREIYGIEADFLTCSQGVSVLSPTAIC